METKSIEIYVRHSGGKAMLNFHIPEDVRDAFFLALQRGSFEAGSGIEVNFEMSVLPAWITDRDQREAFSKHCEYAHSRIPISVINVGN